MLTPYACTRAMGPRRYVPHPPLLTLLQLLLLCCTVGCLAAPPSGCRFDTSRERNRQTSVVRELPRKGEGAVQAYTASAASNSDDSKDNENWAPIRIKAHTRDLNDPSRYCTRAGDYCDTPSYNRQYCYAESVLTVRKKKILLEWALPAAIKLHTDRLRVQPAEGTVKLRREEFLSGQCLWYNIPEEHFTKGLSDADMHFYVSATASNGNSVAFLCQRLANKRPIASAFNLEPRSVLATENFVRTIAHEMAHGLGFEGMTFAYLNMTATEFKVRGKPYVNRIVTPKAKEIAQKYYNCNNALGLEVEDQGASAVSHFEMRNVKHELMSPVSSAGDTGGSYSALTLAVFHDMKFYQANFSMAEPLRWANNSGCDFLEKKCIENGKSNYPDMFCTTTKNIPGYLQCTYDRMALGVCATTKYPEELEPHFQYLWKPYQGGSRVYMDYCPYVEKATGGGCTDGRSSTIIGSIVGPDARCVKGIELKYDRKYIGDVCVNTSCEDGELRVKFQRDENWYPCKEGAHVTPKYKGLWSGSIICPKYDDVCTRYPNITNKEPLPEVTKDDDQPAPANITWPISRVSSAASTPPEDPNAVGEEIHGAPKESKDTVMQKLPVGVKGSKNTVREKLPVGVKGSKDAVREKLPVGIKESKVLNTPENDDSNGSDTQDTHTGTTLVEHNDRPNMQGNRVGGGGGGSTNGNAETVHALNNSAGMTLDIGIGDGSVTAAGHPSLLLLILVSAVIVGVSL